MGTRHGEQHPLSGKTVKLRIGKPDVDQLNGADFQVEDWWDRIANKSWMFCDGNPACMKYGMRSGFAGLPTDNEVVYGHVGPYGHLVHESELAAAPQPPPTLQAREGEAE